MSRIVVHGFETPWSEHAHLLKHVVQVTERDQRRNERDSERWEELIAEPPLTADLSRRRERALSVLSAVKGCLAGHEGETSGRPCDRCQDRGATHVVSREMAPLTSMYLAAAQAAVDAAFQNPDRHGPRLVAYRTSRGRTKLETVDARHVRVVATRDGPSGAYLLTCYRDRTRTVQQSWLELARIRASHRRAGTLENVE
jgi:hypothetical protein